VLTAVPLAIILLPFVAVGGQVDAWVSDEMSDSSALWTGLVVFALLAGDILFPVPSSLVATAAGGALGAVFGTVVVATAMTVGCAVGFMLAGRLGSRCRRHVLDPVEYARIEDWFARFGVAVLVICRPLPVLAEASVLVAGAARIPLRTALLATGLANVGIAAMYATLGSLARGWLSFLLIFAGACILPAGAGLFTRRLRSAGGRHGPQGRRSVESLGPRTPRDAAGDGGGGVLSTTLPGPGARRVPRQ